MSQSLHSAAVRGHAYAMTVSNWQQAVVLVNSVRLLVRDYIESRKGLFAA